ncbi:alpha-L-arabinofuranosidase [Sphingomonas glacialis]|uniref:non-reducing end alpha-L-arabinofuranosidase n=1 Tax=Sphingomonas glacialis TaxID=658225 RepID=A0ABQ3LMU7_9SPHN|nr:alpha-L-arabinofuranosidase C-terminal domain-containing protein [Sphingomonas glacialis]GHH19568.1 alpha-L-arabinofuranosidase [Sphingomonas glacialis]
MTRRAGFALSLATVLLASTAAVAQDAASDATASATVHADRPGPVMARQVFGQFAEHLGHGIYGGIWVGEGSKIPNDHGYRRDVIDALRAIKVPTVRWPGGCFADEYHWRDGVGARGKRPVKINTNWGGVDEDNAFGTPEFMGFLERLGAEAYVSANVGSAPPSETAQWVEYMTSPNGSSLAKERAADGHPAPFKVPYLGIGNELWGCGGNMRAEYAADLTNRYAAFAKSGSGKMRKIASGPSDSNYEWTDTLMRLSGKHIDGLSLHYYTRPRDVHWNDKGAALGFPESEWASTMAHTLQMEEFVTKHSAIMDKYDPAKKVWLVVDEWGTWYDPAPGSNPGFLVQQNSVRDAVVAGLNLNIFAHHADRVKMAAVAQMVNVLQAMLLTDGAKMVKTPTYWVFDLYLPWMDATTLPIEVTSPWYHKDAVAVPAISASAVRDTAGQVHVALVNLDPNRSIPLSMALAGVSATSVTGRIVTGATMDAHNSFEQPDAVKPVAFTAAQVAGSTLTATIPAKSVVVLDLR